LKIAKKIYYDLATGNVIQEIGEREGSVIETTAEEDFQSYISLAERVPSTVGVVQLTWGQYREKFGVYHYAILDGAIVWGDLIDIDSPPIIVQPTNQEVIDGQLILMDVMATMYEGMLEKGTV